MLLLAVPSAFLIDGAHPSARCTAHSPRRCSSLVANLRVTTEVLPQQSAVTLTVDVSAAATQRAHDAAAGEAASAVSSLLSDELPRVLQEQQAELRMIGQAQLLEEPMALIARFEPGEELRVSFRADVWPTMALEAGQCHGLRIPLRRPAFEQDKYEAALLELRQRYASFDGELPALDDALAEQVSSGLTMERLDALLRERVERESAIRDSATAFDAAEEAVLTQLPVAALPETLVVERARQQYGAELRKRQEAASTDAERQEVKNMMGWSAFDAFLDERRAGVERALRLSFSLEAIAEAEGLKLDPQAMEDNLGMYVMEATRRGEIEGGMEGGMAAKEDPAFRARFEAEYFKEQVLRHVIDHADVSWAAAG